MVEFSGYHVVGYPAVVGFSVFYSVPPYVHINAGMP
jgi:hypothetical protein